MNKNSDQKPFIKLGNYLVNLKEISYIEFVEDSNNKINQAVIYLKATEGKTGEEGYLEPVKLEFWDEQARLIHYYFADESQTHVLF